MSSSATELRPASVSPSRIARLKDAVQQAAPAVCPERALLWTEYFADRGNRAKPRAIQAAEALAHVLAKKQVRIHPDELVVGNFSSKRVGGAIYPELHGVAMLREIATFPHRRVNPLAVSRDEIAALQRIMPFWAPRMLGFRVYRSPWNKASFLREQLAPRHYVLNELAGIAHVVPDYAKLIAIGTDGIAKEARAAQQLHGPASEQWAFLEGVAIIADALARFGERYAPVAERLAAHETDTARRAELGLVAATCRRVPRFGARSFVEAVQSITFAQIALNLESLDNGISPGRLDQLLMPYYLRDRARGVLDREGAKEWLAAFAIKLCEVVPVFSETATRMHGGLMSGQAVTMGGTDRAGRDATNELTYVLLELADELRMRQPNFHARLHAEAPRAYVERVAEVLCGGANAPALYNDAVIVPALRANGYADDDAHDYAICGCVEPIAPGRTFGSTDAALFNLPIVLELALNEGRRFGMRRRSGPRTPHPSRLRTMDDVRAAFETQLAFQVDRLVRDLQAVERAHRKFHPTPLTSMLLAGCVEQGTCSTAGGAVYNGSGIQGVGASDTGDSLHAIARAVFADERLGLPALVDQLKRDLPDDELCGYLRRLEKFGNDRPETDAWTAYVVDAFTRALGAYANTRGGPYTTGLYSMTTHQYFGSRTGASANGRRRGAPFASGIAPADGMDRAGPTALFNSVNRIDFGRVRNGANLNARFDPHTLRGHTGRAAFVALLGAYFRRGGMQLQTNVLDTAVLREARAHPERHPHLLVRISGYCAYFGDLTPEMQDEIIRRTEHGIGGGTGAPFASGVAG
ncbi:MAG: formate acetyltransferase [Deltaproteobacteria bacterium]|nr:formate acetyltransferase [Deltaproteobacteria bacterium]